MQCALKCSVFLNYGCLVLSLNFLLVNSKCVAQILSASQPQFTLSSSNTSLQGASSASHTVVVTDHLDSQEDISGKADIDITQEKSLVIRWDLDVDDAIDYQIFVQESRDESANYLGRTGSGTHNHFEFEKGNSNLKPNNHSSKKQNISKHIALHQYLLQCINTSRCSCYLLKLLLQIDKCRPKNKIESKSSTYN